MNALPVIAGLFALAVSAHAQPSSCSSDGVAPPAALLERFTSADCEACWSDRLTPEAAAGALALDWVTPGSRGDEAPLAAVASADGLARLATLARQEPPRVATVFTRRIEARLRLRVAHGLPVGDYIGTSIEFAPPAAGAWKAWLLLVETLPAGTAGSPVARRLVRNAFTAEWSGREKRYELRPMRIPEGAEPKRLGVVGWLEDARGKVVAIAQSRCR